MELSQRLRRIVVLSLIVIFLALLYQFRETLPILILALLLSYILTPIVVWMSSKKVFKRKISRGVSVITIYLVMIMSISFGGAYFVINLSNELQILIKDIPRYGEHFTETWVPTISKGVQNVSKYMPKVEKAKPKTEHEIGEHDPLKNIITQSSESNEVLTFLRNTRFEIKQGKGGYEIIPHEIRSEKEEAVAQEFDLAKIINDFISGIFENLQSILLGTLDFGQIVIFSVVSSIFQTFITLMVAAFIIIDHEPILAYFLNLFPPKFKDRVEMFLTKQNVGLAGVVRGQLIICLVNGTLTGIGLFILDVKFALTLSLLATVCSLIPIFGVIISSVPIVLMAITDSFFTGLLVLGWILIIHFIEANILNPKIIGKSAEIHPVLVILALLAGENAAGIFGALIAVPLFSILQNTFYFILEVVFEEEVTEETDTVHSEKYAALDEAVLDD